MIDTAAVRNVCIGARAFLFFVLLSVFPVFYSNSSANELNKNELPVPIKDIGLDPGAKPPELSGITELFFLPLKKDIGVSSQRADNENYKHSIHITEAARFPFMAGLRQATLLKGNGSKENIGKQTTSMKKQPHDKTNDKKFELSKGRNGTAPTIKLASGYDMPIVGLGTYSLHGENCIRSVRNALASGIRKFDTASVYGNEEEVGKGIRESGLPREEIFVTTKLYPNQYSNPEAAIEESLRKLDIEYIDLMLLHHPGQNDVKAYKAMEKYVAAGKIRSLGVSCFYIKEIDEFLKNVNIKPVLVQNEVHPYYQDTKVVEHLLGLGIVVEAWYPLGGRGHQKVLFSDSVLGEIAATHNKSVAQIILRWQLQRGIVVIPGSSNPAHIKENISVFDFSLTEKEMERIAELNRNEKHDWY